MDFKTAALIFGGMILFLGLIALVSLSIALLKSNAEKKILKKKIEQNQGGMFGK